MQNSGVFWSGILRALLSLRRDKNIALQSDLAILRIIPALETGSSTRNEILRLCEQLCPPEHSQRISQSIISYLDFNKLGTPFYYLSVCENIEEALNFAHEHPKCFFSEGFQIELENHNDSVQLHFPQLPLDVMSECLLLYFLALFRHLAGRSFDFTSISTPNGKIPSLLSSLTQAINKQNNSIVLTFSQNWLKTPSYFYSQPVKLALTNLISPATKSTLQQQLLNLFEGHAAPARIRAQWCANALTMTESTFRRKLRAEGISFGQLLRQHIHERATSALLKGQRVDDVCAELGYADRRSFDRSFKEQTGVNPGQLRQITLRIKFKKGNDNLLGVINNLPPLPQTLARIINSESKSLTVSSLTQLVSQDPIFHAHIMGKASKAIYGTPPQSLEQAISRNLGVGNIQTLAILFAAQQQLGGQSKLKEVSSIIDAMLLSKNLYAALYSLDTDTEQGSVINQLLVFGPLSLLLFLHNDNILKDGIWHCWQSSDNFAEFITLAQHDYGLCLYGATSLLLVQWGFTGKVNHMLWKLCQSDDLDSDIATRIIQCHQMAFDVVIKGIPLEQVLADMDEIKSTKLKREFALWQR